MTATVYSFETPAERARRAAERLEQEAQEAADRAAAELTAAQTEAARQQALAAQRNAERAAQEISVLQLQRDNAAREAALLEARMAPVRRAQAEAQALARRVERLLHHVVHDHTPVPPLLVNWVDGAVRPLKTAAAAVPILAALCFGYCHVADRAAAAKRLSTSSPFGWSTNTADAGMTSDDVVLLIVGTCFATAVLLVAYYVAATTVASRPEAAEAARMAEHSARVRRFVAARIRRVRVDAAPAELSPSGLPKLNLHVSSTDVFEDLHALLEQMNLRPDERARFNAEYAAWCVQGEPEVAAPRQAVPVLGLPVSPKGRSRALSPGARNRRR